MAELQTAKNEEIAQKWLAAFSQKDLDALLCLYADDAVHYSPKLKMRKPETMGLVQGKAAMAQWWQEAFDRLPTLHYQYTTLTANADRVFIEYVRSVSGEPDMLVAEALDITNGLIKTSRVYHG